MNYVTTSGGESHRNKYHYINDVPKMVENLIEIHTIILMTSLQVVENLIEINTIILIT